MWEKIVFRFKALYLLIYWQIFHSIQPEYQRSGSQIINFYYMARNWAAHISLSEGCHLQGCDAYPTRSELYLLLEFCWLLSFLLNPEDGDSVFLRNMGKFYQTTRHHIPEDVLFIVTAVRTWYPTRFLFPVKVYETISVPVVLYGCEIWSLGLREEHRLMVTENGLLMRTVEPNRGEVTGGRRKLQVEELHNLYSSPDTVLSRWTN
jgi:hypothetical protein